MGMLEGHHFQCLVGLDIPVQTKWTAKEKRSYYAVHVAIKIIVLLFMLCAWDVLVLCIT